MKKTHWKKLKNPDYLGSWDFQPGEERVEKIKSVGAETVDNGKTKDECLVCRFHGKTKPLILNTTNSKAISKVAGSDYIEDWKDLHITLFTTRISAFGEEMDAVRVRKIKPVIKLPELTPDNPKWEKAKESIANGSATIEGIRKHYMLSSINEQKLISNE